MSFLPNIWESQHLDLTERKRMERDDDHDYPKAQRTEIYHQQLALDVPRPRQTIIVLAMGQGLAVDIRGEVAHSRLDPAIQGTTVRQMATKTHAGGANSAIAGGK